MAPSNLKLDLPRLMLRIISHSVRLSSGNDEQLVNRSVRQFIDIYASDPQHRDDELVKGVEIQPSSTDKGSG